jgi:hypothetical protein
VGDWESGRDGSVTFAGASRDRNGRGGSTLVQTGKERKAINIEYIYSSNAKVNLCAYPAGRRPVVVAVRVRSI